jgi:hypothetical protein
MVDGLSLGSYVMPVDYTGRLFRESETAISCEVAEILERLGTSAETWQARLRQLSEGRMLGRFPLLLRRTFGFGGSSILLRRTFGPLSADLRSSDGGSSPSRRAGSG